MKADPIAKIKMLNGSMRCFVYGLVALIPLFGLPYAIAALWISGRVRNAEKIFWNAGRPYRICGAVIAALAIVFWFFIASLIIYNLANPSDSNSRGSYSDE